MSNSRVAILLLVFAIALPTGFFQPAPRGDAGRDPALAAAASGSAPISADIAAPLFKKTDREKADKKRKNDARDRQTRHEQARKPTQRKRDRGRDQIETHGAPTRRELTEQREETCDGPGMIFLPKSGLCTHGPDPAPPGVDPTRRARPVPAASARVAAEPLTCDGNGQSGPRVQVLYAHASNVQSRFGEYLASFRTWAVETDEIMQESAAAGGGNLRFRFVTDPGCQFNVQEVTLSPTGDDTFDNTIVELKAQGFTRTDRYYLVFVDTTSAGICGVGTGTGDDGPGQANWNNYGPGFSRVDAGCWNAYTAAHELMHNLGAVNDSAPNTTGFGHCIDDYDVMCYSDPPNRPAMRIDCPDEALEDRYDCGYDDYFNPAPNPGSYLASHWNTADNRFLVGGGNGDDDDGAPPAVTWISPTGNDTTHQAAAGMLNLEVAATDGSGINRVRFWRYDSETETSVELAIDRAAPYTTTLPVSDLSPGYNSVWVVVTDGAQTFTVESIGIRRTEQNPAPPELTWTAPVGNGERHRASRGTISLDVDASDPAGIAVVEFARYDDVNEKWVELAADESAPFRTSLAVADLRPGQNYVLAEAFDPFNNFTAEHIWIERTEPAVPVAITSPRNGSKVKAGANVALAAAVNDNAGPTTVEFRSCGGGSCAWGAASPIATDQSAPYSASWKAPKSGTFTFLAQVTDDDGSEVSDPVTVSIPKAKKKKKKKR